MRLHSINLLPQLRNACLEKDTQERKSLMVVLFRIKSGNKNILHIIFRVDLFVCRPVGASHNIYCVDYLARIAGLPHINCSVLIS